MATEEVLKSELDLFRKVYFQKSIEHSAIIQYRPTTALTESSTVEFVIKIGPDDYLDPQNIFLSVTGKLVHPDGTPFPESEDNRFSLVDYGLNTIWDLQSIYINNNLINQASNIYGYLAYIEGLQETSEDKLSTILEAAGFYSRFENTNPVDFDKISTNYAKNFNRSRKFKFYGKLHGLIFNSDKLLLNGLEMRLIFNKAPDNFCCLGTAAEATVKATEPKLKILDVSLFVRKVQISKSVLAAHERALQTSRALYPIKRSLIKVFNLPKDQSVFYIDNITTGQMPSKLIAGIVTNNAFMGTNSLNPFKFGNNNLIFLVAKINNESFPRNPYMPDFENNNYQREYYDFFLNIGATQGKDIPKITYESYKSGHCLYAWNFNSDMESTDANEWISVPKQGNMSIELRFKSNLTEALKLICYFQYDNLIEIDSNRNIYLNY